MGPSVRSLARQFPTVEQLALKVCAEARIAGYQPDPLPKGVWAASAGTLAPGVLIAAPDMIISKIGIVEAAEHFVSVRGPKDAVRDEALQRLAAIDWSYEGLQGGQYVLNPERGLWRADDSAIKEQAIKALIAMACLVPPGMSGVRSVGIDITNVGEDTSQVLKEGAEACFGLGISVNLFGECRGCLTVPLGTVMPIFAPPALLAEGTLTEGFSRTLLNYMAAVMAPGRSAGPYDFHLVVDTGSSATEPVRHLFDTLRDDPRLASGAGWVSKAAQVGGLLLALSGLWMVSGYDASTDTAEAWPAFRNMLEGIGLFGAAKVYGSRASQRSRAWPAIATPFTLTVWSDLESNSSVPLTLHRTARDNGTMYTEVRNWG